MLMPPKEHAVNERRTNRGASPEPQTESRMSRAQLLRAGAGAGAAALLAGSLGAGSAFASSGRADATTLNVYSWPNYFSTANLKAFKAKTGTSLNISTYEASDALFAKLNTAAGAGFDLAVPTGGWIPEMVSKGMLQEIDHDKLPFKYIDKSLLDKVYDKGNKYSIPKDYGVAGVVYDPAVVGGTIKTWSDFFDAAAKPAVKGKIQLAASAFDVIGPGIWADNGDWNTTSSKVITAGAERVKAIAKNVKEFSGFDADGMVKGTIALSYCDQALARAAITQNPKLKWVVPGPISELWVDSYVITKKAPNADAAYAFLNFQLQPAHQIADTEFLGYPTVLPGLRGKLKKSTKQVDLIFGGKGVDLDKLTSFVLKPQTAGLYTKLLNEIKAAATG
jgi:spermidine/putrescine transport system substrate-binding protein